MSEQKVIGKGTWIDKLAFELLEREKSLGRNLDVIRVESGLGASGISAGVYGSATDSDLTMVIRAKSDTTGKS
ncbi:MAG: hypothetical protein QQN65_06970, partial [Nitrosopumilus sp.]